MLVRALSVRVQGVEGCSARLRVLDGGETSVGRRWYVIGGTRTTFEGVRDREQDCSWKWNRQSCCGVLWGFMATSHERGKGYACGRA